MRKTKPPKPPKVTNPLQVGILAFLAKKHISIDGDVPKRYTRYGSLLLLGPTFPVHPLSWAQIFSGLNGADKTDLFCTVLQAFKDPTLTHVAINAPITATKTDSLHDENNVIRSPTGLQPVYGNFGPDTNVPDEQSLTQSDFDAAYWTETSQLSNIVQVWAPRWTMFSRGNISEKARILQGGLSKSPFPGLSDTELGQPINEIDVVDFYVGIGYFTLCYLTRGVRRVWGWDLNGWSIEGLRRGCIANQYGIRVVKIDERGEVAEGRSLNDLVNDIQHLDRTTEAIRCVAFCGDNRWASKVLNEIGMIMHSEGRHTSLNIRHCNLGLLPSSSDGWDGAIQVLNPHVGGWLHVHENVETSGIGSKQEAILRRLKEIATERGKERWSALCDHVEQVKTYAPGVVHCVYDIKIDPLR